jgi:CRP-like cAMP-binding protein
MSAFDTLRSYLEGRAPFSREELELARALFVPRSLRAGEVVQRAGDIAQYGAFVATGCLRSYVIDAKGTEHLVQFAPETWWLSDPGFLTPGTPAKYFIDAIEPSEVLLIDGPSHDRLIEESPGFAATYRLALQRKAAAKDRRILSSLGDSAEARYLDFLETYPSIAVRVPQRMLASYLGVSPETVSRIRKNLSRRAKTT